MHSMTVVTALLAVLQIHVAPNGDDANPGTRERPVATLQGARDALRRGRAANPATFAAGGAEVVLADGTYWLSEPLAFVKEDGGEGDRRVVWKAANRGKASVSGGIALEKWRPVEDPAVLALLGEDAKRHVRVTDIPGDADLPGFTGGGSGTAERFLDYPVSVFCGGRRLEVAQWPDEGYAHTGRNVGEIRRSHDSTYCLSGVFRYDDAAKLATWAREPDLWFFGLWVYEWADATVRAKGIDTAAGTIAVDREPIGFGIREGAQFRALNALSEINRPGEWAIDRRNRRLYCWLPEGGGSRLDLAMSAGLVSVTDARNLAFEGLVFEYTRKVALRFTRCAGCAVVGSTIRHTTSWGVVIDGGTSDRVAGCDLYDLGEGGVRLSGGDRLGLVPAGHVADNNHIHHYGLVNPNYRPGVQLDGVGNRATHNLIHHTRHQALAFGGNDHYIGFNVCHDCCTYNDDAGTIYCCQRDWTRRGTVIEHNLVHMTGKQPRAKHTEAIYLDDFSSGVTVRGNIINRADLGIYLGGGQDCRVCGNLIMNCRNGLALGSRGIETFAKHVSGKGRESEMFRQLEDFRRKWDESLWRARYPNMFKVYDFEDAVFAHNALFNVMTNNVLVGCSGIEKSNWKKVGSYNDVSGNLESADDSGLADYFGLDWSVRPGTAAYAKLGAMKFGEMGLYPSVERASPAVKFGREVTPPRPFASEYAQATVRVDVPFLGTLPAGVTNCAVGVEHCDVPEWSRGMRVVTGFGAASLGDWMAYGFTFTPEVSGPFLLVTMGERGEKTLYDDFRVEGAELVNGGLEGEGGWTVPKELNRKDSRFGFCNNSKPWGLVTAADTGVPAAEGARCICGNDMINIEQRIECTKGVPVKVTFKARALPLK